MWYFSWVLGLGLACCFAVMNAMWFELHTHQQREHALHDIPEEKK